MLSPQYNGLGGLQVGTGDRSEKIKTYNYKDSRVSDHRIKANYDLDRIMDGKLLARLSWAWLASCAFVGGGCSQ
jgi:protein subunit release factor A